MIHQATLELGPNGFIPLAPPDLVQKFHTIVKLKQFSLLRVLYEDYYVICGVTGEKIRLSDLQYWDIKHDMVFRDHLVAFRWRYPGRDDRDEQRGQGTS